MKTALTFVFFTLLLSAALHAQSVSIIENNPLQEVRTFENQIKIWNDGSESCDNLIANHIEVVNRSEAFIKSLTKKSAREVKTQEITALQKNLINRYQHLKKTMNAYNSPLAFCKPIVLAEALSVFDYTNLGENALKSNHVRRAIQNLASTPLYGLENLPADYAHYTSKKVLKQINAELLKEETFLPGFEVKKKKQITRFKKSSDSTLYAANNTVSNLAKIWGKLSDQLKWREGYLKEESLALNLMKKKLKPLDLIFEKRTFVLSNYTIPGHWGHVAVWLGTMEELIEIGVWDQDFFAPFKEQVLAGRNIVEIRKQGINFQTLEDFMNLDEVAVVRLNNLVNLTSIYQGLVAQEDRAYDFNFNAHTPDRITCTELIAYSYGDLDWGQSKTLGFVNIKPDDLAAMSVRSTQEAEFVLYLEGKKEAKQDEETFINHSEENWKNLFIKKPLIINEALNDPYRLP